MTTQKLSSTCLKFNLKTNNNIKIKPKSLTNDSGKKKQSSNLNKRLYTSWNCKHKTKHYFNSVTHQNFETQVQIFIVSRHREKIYKSQGYCLLISDFQI